jgi:hypothetical protein
VDQSAQQGAKVCAFGAVETVACRVVVGSGDLGDLGEEGVTGLGEVSGV